MSYILQKLLTLGGLSLRNFYYCPICAKWTQTLRIFIFNLQGGARNDITLIVHITPFLLLQKHLTSGTELILISWKWKLFLMKNMFSVTTVLRHNLLQTNPCIRHNFSTQVFSKRAAQLHYVGPELRYIFWYFLAFSGLQRRPENTRKCSAAQGPHSEFVPRAYWRLVSKSCDECKGLFARGCEAKRWSHWTCSSLGTIFQPMRINSVPDDKCFCNNKNVLCAQSMVWHFVRHSVFGKHPVVIVVFRTVK